MSDKKMEIVYYKLVEMEQRLTEKAEVILRARDEINTSLNRFELLVKDLIGKIENK
jgi:hypothetical protein